MEVDDEEFAQECEALVWLEDMPQFLEPEPGDLRTVARSFKRRTWVTNGFQPRHLAELTEGALK